MALLYRDGQRPPQRALEIIVGYMNRVAYPVYLGYIALEVGYSLARTKEILDVLEEEGVVHQLDPIELVAAGFRDIAVVYTVVGKPQLHKAWR